MRRTFAPSRTLKYEEPIITIGQARRLLGKQVSDGIDDIYLSRMIGLLSSLAESLIDANLVPKNDKVL